MNYDKSDVLSRMKGMWQDALQSIVGWDKKAFNKKHQPCPYCGGNDRFRFTDNVEQPGDGGAICSQCGGGDGVSWLMKCGGVPFHEAINALGEFIGGVPVEYVAKRNKIASKTLKYSFGATVDHDACINVLSGTERVDSTQMTRILGIISETGFDVGVSAAGEEFVCLPVRQVFSDGVSDEMCNIAFSSTPREIRFMARKFSPNGVTVIGKQDSGVIILVANWHEGFMAHMSTGCEVWVCYRHDNMEMVAHEYNGDRKLVVACKPTDNESIYAADDANLDVIQPRNGNFKMGFEGFSRPVE